MARRRREEPHVSHERWVISYADFITLLLAFFVVMYSVSSVNDGKYRVLSDSLTTAFQASSRQLDPVSAGSNAYQGDAGASTMILLPVPGSFPEQEDFQYSIRGLLDNVENGAAKQGEATQGDTDHWTALSDRMSDALTDLVSVGDARVVDKGEWLEVNIQSSVVFGSGSAILQEKAKPALVRLATLIAGEGSEVQVEGHTDAIPIQNDIYPSNWELSSARAAAVVRWFMQHGVKGEKLAAVGYGEQRPVADNATADGRAANRRIAIMIAKRDPDDPVDRPENDYKLRSDEQTSASARKGPVVALSVTRMTLEQARQRWQIAPTKTRGTP